MAKSNKNLSKSYKAAYLQKSDPELGSRTPAGKDSTDNRDSQKNASLKFEKVRPAKAEVGTVRVAHEKQDGKNLDNASHANSGCGESE